jgi:hypothetical protein
MIIGFGGYPCADSLDEAIRPSIRSNHCQRFSPSLRERAGLSSVGHAKEGVRQLPSTLKPNHCISFSWPSLVTNFTNGGFVPRDNTWT